ncbi:MAG: sensor histidine kinase [Algibacter sp.]|uniref:sensor histidine kinase n=1 Tax=Algibacter sp. TaxID=1872428 RepID=UPI0032997A38
MKINKYQIVITTILLIGLLFLNQFISSYYASENKKIEDTLKKTHSDALIRARAGIDVYATLVSSLKSYTKNNASLPTDIELQTFLKDLLDEIKFNNSIIVNYIDTTHVFRYIITPNEIDPLRLKGVSVKDFVDKDRIDQLNNLMLTEDISLFTPINLREGWVGFPFNFSARDKNNNLLGYFTPIINAKYLLDYFYEGNSSKEFVHKFRVEDSFDLTRETYYDGSSIYNVDKDLEYYKNFDVKEDDYIYSDINVFNLKLKVGSAYKNKPKVNNTLAFLAYLWYVIISFLIIIIYNQFSKNIALNENLKIANEEISNQNSELATNLSKVQTLIKEIHHRVKNNMQMISGILTLQQDESNDTKVKTALEQSKNRINSMALVHEKLYGSISLKDIRAKEYLEQLIDFVERTVKSEDLNLKKTITIDKELNFDGDTTSNLGLIINELITNSFKYAFKNDRINSLSISILQELDYYVLIYEDSGPGMPENYNFENSNSLGMQLILILTEQLQGKLEYSNAKMSTFIIYFNPLIPSFKD